MEDDFLDKLLSLSSSTRTTESSRERLKIPLSYSFSPLTVMSATQLLVTSKFFVMFLQLLPKTKK